MKRMRAVALAVLIGLMSAVGAGENYLVALASAARTGTTASVDFDTPPYVKGVMITTDVTAIVTAPSITVDIQAQDPVSGKYTSILVSAAITSVSTTRQIVYPGITTVANVATNYCIPTRWRVNVTHANGNSITYSIGAALLP